jgi:hypothetical protein
MTSEIRYRQIRRADEVDDQADSGEIANAIPNSFTQDDYQRYFLSRLRQVIFGDASVHHWYEDFENEGILSLLQLSQGLNQVTPKVGIPLIGARDGTNRKFTTPDKFINNLTTMQTIEVFSNSRRLIQTSTTNPGVGDYWISESGGPGTGFDTINLLTFTPVARTTLVANYQVAA